MQDLERCSAHGAFVLIAWLFLLATYALTVIEGSGLPMADAVVPIDSAATNPLAFRNFA